MNYVFSQEIYLKEYYTPKKKGTWVFGDGAKTYLIKVGTETEPLSYSQAVKQMIKILDEMREPIYKTVYLYEHETIDLEEGFLCRFGGKIKQLLKAKKSS